MKQTVRLLILVSVCFSLFFLPDAGGLKGQDQHGEFWKIVTAVENILLGKDLDQAKSLIGQRADLIWRGRLMNLRQLVAGENKTFSLVDTAFHGVAITGRTNQAEDMGIITLKTVKHDTTQVRFHTVVFLKDSTGEFRIISWNASGNE
jgi:hypothetical protein